MVFLSKLRIYSSDEKLLISIHKALHPDNLITPSEMNIREYFEKEGEMLAYVIEISVMDKSKNFDSLRGTLDEILTLITVLDKIVRSE